MDTELVFSEIVFDNNKETFPDEEHKEETYEGEHDMTDGDLYDDDVVMKDRDDDDNEDNHQVDQKDKELVKDDDNEAAQTEHKEDKNDRTTKAKPQPTTAANYEGGWVDVNNKKKAKPRREKESAPKTSKTKEKANSTSPWKYSFKNFDKSRSPAAATAIIHTSTSRLKFRPTRNLSSDS